MPNAECRIDFGNWDSTFRHWHSAFGSHMIKTISATLLFGAATLLAQTPGSGLGYTDTPMLPGVPYHVHDPGRPHPAVVAPGAQPGAAPSDAVVLFGGKDLSQWTPSKQPWARVAAAASYILAR